MNKGKILIITLLCLISKINAQLDDSLSKAYYFENIANCHFINGANDSALKNYLISFSFLGEYSQAFEKSYLKAAEISSDLGDYETTYLLLDTVFSYGFYLNFSDNFFKKIGFQKFKESKQYIKFQKRSQYFSIKYLENCKESTVRFISELYYKDQIGRKIVITLLEKFKNNFSDTLIKSMTTYSFDLVDCDTRKRLKYFFSNNEISFFKHNTHYFPILILSLFIHNLEPNDPDHQSTLDLNCDYNRREFYHDIQPILLDMVKRGYLNNKTYAGIIDKAHNRYFGYQVYGTILNSSLKNETPIINYSNVDSIRHQIGLPKLLETCNIK